MPKKWKPSLKQLSVYDELLARQNKTRKLLLKRRKRAEEETSFGRGLPDLIIPKKQRRYRDLMRYLTRFDSYEEYRNQIRALQMLYGGKGSPEFQFYRSSYRNNILNLIKEWIGDYLNFNEKPKGYFGKYSDEQIQIASIIADGGEKFLLLYNKMISLSIGEFMTMYDSGYIPKLKYIYAEMKGIGSIEFSFVDEFLSGFSDFRRQAREQRNIMFKDVEKRKNYLGEIK